MRYARIETEDGSQYVAVEDRGGVAFATAILAPPEEDLTVTSYPGKFAERPLNDCTLLAPVRPSKIVCIGRNYREHAAEFGNEPPKEPLLFLKAPSALLAPGEKIVLPPQSRRVDYEAELGVVIGRTCSQLADDADVGPYIRGYVCVNDVTARDLQKSDGQWSRAKGFDTFCPVGPWVTDEVDPAEGLNVATHVNGELKQHGNTRDLIFDVPKLIRYISQAMTLFPGDLIPTGTPAGVSPIADGDVVRVSVDGCGILENAVISGRKSI
ncbi:MAG TPA: fumarylacetoacetate hydrolase family protein [Acidobacteriaceae bacterium]|nr:fumarylacetoacetate hydrolase family protein [Acidobacteriaceae bacterium]